MPLPLASQDRPTPARCCPCWPADLRLGQGQLRPTRVGRIPPVERRLAVRSGPRLAPAAYSVSPAPQPRRTGGIGAASWGRGLATGTCHAGPAPLPIIIVPNSKHFSNDPLRGPAPGPGTGPPRGTGPVRCRGVILPAAGEKCSSVRELADARKPHAVPAQTVFHRTALAGRPAVRVTRRAASAVRRARTGPAPAYDLRFESSACAQLGVPRCPTARSHVKRIACMLRTTDEYLDFEGVSPAGVMRGRRDRVGSRTWSRTPPMPRPPPSRCGAFPRRWTVDKLRGPVSYCADRRPTRTSAAHAHHDVSRSGLGPKDYPERAQRAHQRRGPGRSGAGLALGPRTCPRPSVVAVRPLTGARPPGAGQPWRPGPRPHGLAPGRPSFRAPGGVRPHPRLNHLTRSFPGPRGTSAGEPSGS